MAKARKRARDADAWDDRKLGSDEQFVARADMNEEARVDDVLGLQMISIRLPKRLIEQLKLIALHSGIGYQPLMRDVLSRFAHGELIQVLRQQTALAELEGHMAAAAIPKSRKDVRNLKGVVGKPGRAVPVADMNRAARKFRVTGAAKRFVGSDKTAGEIARHTKRRLRQRP
jgi:hypothetical protein